MRIKKLGLHLFDLIFFMHQIFSMQLDVKFLEEKVGLELIGLRKGYSGPCPDSIEEPK